MLPVERFAELRAEIERSCDRDQVLRGAGLSPREWMHIQRHWLAELAGEAALGRTTLAEKYCRAFEAGAKAAPEAAGVGSEAQPGARPAEAPLVVPSFMVGVRPQPGASPVASAPVPPIAASPAATPPAHRRAATLQGNTGPRAPATPFRAGPPSPEVAQPSPRKEPPAPGGGPGTGTALAVEIPRSLVTPFQKDAEAVQAGAPPASPGAPQATALAVEIPRSLVTPFQKDAEAAKPSAPAASPGAPPAPAAPPAAATAPAEGASTAAKPAPAPSVNAPPPSLTGTTLDSPLARMVAAMPFKPAAAARPPASPSSPAPPQGGAPGAPPAAAQPPAPQPAPAPSQPDPPRPSPAASPPSAAPLPELTVEQYAWLVAALRRTRGPAEVEQAFRALRLSSDMQKPLEERWRARMAADPALQQRFLAALATHLSGAPR